MTRFSKTQRVQLRNTVVGTIGDDDMTKLEITALMLAFKRLIAKNDLEGISLNLTLNPKVLA